MITRIQNLKQNIFTRFESFIASRRDRRVSTILLADKIESLEKQVAYLSQQGYGDQILELDSRIDETESRIDSSERETESRCDDLEYQIGTVEEESVKESNLETCIEDALQEFDYSKASDNTLNEFNEQLEELRESLERVELHIGDETPITQGDIERLLISMLEDRNLISTEGVNELIEGPYLDLDCDRIDHEDRLKFLEEEVKGLNEEGMHANATNPDLIEELCDRVRRDTINEIIARLR
jgi:chromosome segregation ATPase